MLSHKVLELHSCLLESNSDYASELSNDRATESNNDYALESSNDSVLEHKNCVLLASKANRHHCCSNCFF